MTEQNDSGAVLVVEELSLRRYIARHQSDEAQFNGPSVSFRVKQAMFDAAGASMGDAHLCLLGRRAFGGTIHFSIPTQLELPAVAERADREYFIEMGMHLVNVLRELCRCGQTTVKCDCCTTCHGLGTVPGEASASQCSACRGRGWHDVPDNEQH